MVVIYIKQRGITREHLGLIPHFLVADDERDAKEQFNERYVHGGWRSMAGWKLNSDDSIEYYSAGLEEGEEQDPPLYPLAEIIMQGHKERILQYDHGWVCVIQPNGSFEVCRMD